MIWGDLSQEEIKKFGFLSITFMVLIGSYWLIRLLKDVVINHVNGYSCQPTAKMISLLVVIALVSVVAKLVDLVQKQTLFYIVSGAYAVLFIGIAFALVHPTIGLANTVADPSRLLGWVTYCAAESYGSITIPLFWGFVNSITGADSAKRGYPIIFSIGQVGSISAPLLMQNAASIGLGTIGFVAAGAILLFPIMIFVFTSMVPAAASTTAEESKKPKTGVLEGLRLIFTRPYLIGVFGLSTLYEVVGTIFEYQMKSMASAQAAGNSEAFASFLGNYGLYLNVSTLVISLLGTSVLLRRFGLLFTALLFPTIVALMNGTMLVHKTLFVATLASLVLKALSYAVNNPTKELMYIPTSKDVKFKAKGIIDGFGSRLSKATGAAVSKQITGFTSSAADLVTYGCITNFGIIAVWMGAAAYVGGAFNKLTRENKIVE